MIREHSVAVTLPPHPEHPEGGPERPASLTPSPESLELHINGTLLAVSETADLEDFDPALRGVALSDSPVLIQGSTTTCDLLCERLHALGRRNSQPVHRCNLPEEAERLFRHVLDKTDAEGESLGTWALHRVEAWPRELQLSLQRVLEQLDESRLHGRMHHDRLPRVVVLQDEAPGHSRMEPELHQRLSYFSVAARPSNTTDLPRIKEVE